MALQLVWDMAHWVNEGDNGVNSGLSLLFNEWVTMALQGGEISASATITQGRGGNSADNEDKSGTYAFVPISLGQLQF